MAAAGRRAAGQRRDAGGGGGARHRAEARLALDSTKPLTLQQGQHVTLISDTGATLKLDGPYNRSRRRAAGSGVDLTQTMAALVTQRQARAGEFGVTRGTTLAELPDPWLIDATHSGNVCLREKDNPVFWRPDSQGRRHAGGGARGSQLESARRTGRHGHDRIIHHHRRADAQRRDLCRDLQRRGIGRHHGAGAGHA